jgi:hypothetical protein
VVKRSATTGNLQPEGRALKGRRRVITLRNDDGPASLIGSKPD